MKSILSSILLILGSVVVFAHSNCNNVLQTADLNLSDTHINFNAEGGSDTHIRVSCEGTWNISVTTGKEWLIVSKKGDLLVVECLPNTTTEQRTGKIYVFAVIEGGTVIGEVFVQQEKSSDYNYTSQDKPRSSEGVNSANVLSKTAITFRDFEVNPMIKDNNNNIDGTVAVLKENPNLKLQIEAFTTATNRGATYELNLTQRRADKVKQVFINKGVNPSQISTLTHTSNDSEDNCQRAENIAVFRITAD